MASYNPKDTLNRDTSMGMVKVIIIVIVISFLLPKCLQWLASFQFFMRVVSWQAGGVIEKLDSSLGYFTNYIDIGALTKGANPMDLIGDYTGKMTSFWSEGMGALAQFMGIFGG